MPDTTTERREDHRQPLEGEVAVQFEPCSIVGPGQNISSEGVFFVADGALRVRVDVGEGGWRPAEVVRIQSMGEGRLGMAVRFVED